jgi:hypothetical protein
VADPEDSNSQEKRQALLRARNWSEKVRDPESSANATANDPALAKLQQQSEQFNARVHQALADIPVPPALRDQILARNKIVTVPYWRTPRAIAMAAALAFMATGLFFWTTAKFRGEDKTFAGFRSRMVGFALREYRMDIHTNSLAEVQKYLAQKGAPAGFNLPATLAQTPVKGGAALTWQGQPVSMVCFDKLNTTLYMFVIEHSVAPVNERVVAPFKTVATATWTSDGKTFLLTGEVPLSELEMLTKS